MPPSEGTIPHSTRSTYRLQKHGLVDRAGHAWQYRHLQADREGAEVFNYGKPPYGAFKVTFRLYRPVRAVFVDGGRWDDRDVASW